MLLQLHNAIVNCLFRFCSWFWKKSLDWLTKNANGLASNTFSPNCVYVAGCVVVVYNVEMVSNRMPKRLSCVSISKDGCFVAAGEVGLYCSSMIYWVGLNGRCSILSYEQQKFDLAVSVFLGLGWLNLKKIRGLCRVHLL